MLKAAHGGSSTQLHIPSFWETGPVHTVFIVSATSPPSLLTFRNGKPVNPASRRLSSSVDKSLLSEQAGRGSHLWLGRSRADPSAYFRGTLAYFRVWDNIQLNASYVAAAYNWQSKCMTPGAYGQGGYCQPCPAGFYSNTGGAIVCTACPIGTYQPLLGTTTCEGCAAGTFVPSAGSTGCISCPTGMYQPYSFSGSCIQCPANTAQNIVGATSSSQCSACSANTFSAAAASECVPYPDLDIDFRGCTNGVLTTNIHGTSTAFVIGGGECSPQGLTLNGVDSYVELDGPTIWGGDTTFETFVMYSAFNADSRIFEFMVSGAESSAVQLGNVGVTGHLFFSGRYLFGFI